MGRSQGHAIPEGATMLGDEPFVRQAGEGPGVVCIHANASSSAQWRSLMDLLATRYKVLAPDSYGSGQSPDWPSDREIRLSDEVRFLEPVLELAGAPCVIVGHSYGAAVALMAALLHPDRIHALALYEPTLFALVDAQQPHPNGTEGIRGVAAAAGAALDRGDRDGAAQHFIDFWMGLGSWSAMPAHRRPAITESIVNVRRWAHALMNEPTPAQAFARLDIPVLYMHGTESPESAHAVARVLIPTLPQVRVVEFPGLGHMAPVTHPDPVNAEIEAFLRQIGHRA
jgi:pimeloyl-ACP methyl ester carboxylesterase